MSADFLILTAAQAQTVAGVTDANGLSVGLAPVLLVNGSYALPLSVLTDPAHAAQQAVLSTFPQQAVDDSQWPQD